MNAPPVESQPVTPRRFRWLLFMLALLLPPIITFLTALAGWKDFPVASAFVGSGIAGLVCGIQLGRRLGKSDAAAVLLSLLFIGVFGALCFFLCFGGCMMGNYQLNLH